METKKIIREAALIILHLVPFIYLIMIYDRLPEQVPVHFNLAGEADSYSAKSSLFWMIALLNGISYILFLVIPFIDPKKFTSGNPGIYLKIRVGMGVLFTGLSCMMVYLAGGDALKGILFLGLMIAALCIFLGNYFQAIKSNYFIGIRTPWTLHSEEIWKKTHLLTGRLLFFGGLLSVPLIFVLPANLAPAAPAVVLVVACLYGVVYSFLLFKRHKGDAL